MNEELIVVGKNSYIGRYFTKFAIENGHQVIALSSKDCDFLDKDAVIDFFRSLGQASYSVVFFAAVNKSKANDFQAFLDNIHIVQNLINGLKFATITSLIYFSSVDMYGASPVLPITEQSRINPDTWYGLAKCNCEWMLTASKEVDCPVTVMRIPGVYGPGSNDRSVIGQLVRGILEEKKVIIHGTGNVLRDYVYVEDICRLLWKIIPLRHEGVLNIATGHSHAIVDITQSIGQTAQAEYDLTLEPTDPTREFDLTFDIDALRKLLPDFQFSELSAGIRSYLL